MESDKTNPAAPGEIDADCISCEEDPDPDDPMDYDNYKCPQSNRPCGHHCNHAWSHEKCCWCGREFGGIEESPELEMGCPIEC